MPVPQTRYCDCLISVGTGSNVTEASIRGFIESMLTTEMSFGVGSESPLCEPRPWSWVK